MYSFLPASVFSLFSLVSALPLTPQVGQDVWTPQITNPSSSSVWIAEYTYSVTWDASDPPSEITNPTGQIYLREGPDATSQTLLADGFLLTDGYADVTIPANTPPDTDYIVVLFGDSGDWSQEFTIIALSS